ncbi:MAG: GTPase [Polyangiaceae bacterium]|jgi:predicted GTPase
MSSEDQALKMLARTIQRLEELLDRLPVEIAKDLRGRIATLRTVVLEKRPPAIVLVGRRGAGKSSLVNALFGAKVAELGHVTAQTGRGRWYDYERNGGAMSILDTRGVQEGSAPAEGDDARTALDSIAVELRSKPPDLVVFVAKASEVDAAVDNDLLALERVYDEIRRAHKVDPPLIVVVTHCDLLEPKAIRLHASAREPEVDVDEKLRHVAAAEIALAAKIDLRPRLAPRHTTTLGVSAYMSWRPDGSLRADDRWRIDDLAVAMFRQMPDSGRAELARVTRARAVQEDLANTLTRATAALCAGIAAAPIPLADIVPLTTLQGALVAAIAWIAGRSLDRRGATEFLASLGANVGFAFLLREAVRAVLKVIAPAAGPVISAGVAFSGTMAIGAAARAYFIAGVSLEEARRVLRRQKDVSATAGDKSPTDIPPPTPAASETANRGHGETPPDPSPDKTT